MALHAQPIVVPFKPVTTPVIKWAGGKTSLLPELVKRMPTDWRRGEYYEPFIGGGALFFALAPTRATIGDINPRLTTMYGAIQTDVDRVIRNLRQHAKHHDAHHYERVRATMNDASVFGPAAQRAAHLIYLNKTCFTPGSIALTDDEKFIGIEDVKVGDRMWGGRTVHEVLRRQYQGSIYRIKAHGYPHPLSVTDEHPVLCCRRLSTGAMSEPAFVAAGKLTLEDYLLMPGGGSVDRLIEWKLFWPAKEDLYCNVRMVTPNFDDEKADRDFARLIGYYVADGFCGDRNVTFTMPTDNVTSTTGKSTITNEIVEICQRRFGITPKVRKEIGNKVSIEIHSSYVRHFVGALAPGQTHSTDPAKRHTKRLHDSLMTAPIDVQLAILAAWIKADGGLRAKVASVELTGQTVVDDLARQFHRMAQRCGMKPSWRWYFPKTKSSMLTFSSTDAARMGFPVPSKGEDGDGRRGKREGDGGRRPVINGLMATKIAEITRLEYDGFVYNVEVDGDHHLCVDGFVSHNCFNGLYRENKAGDFNVPIGAYEKPAICRPPILRAAAKVLMPAAIATGNYDEITCTAARGDFVYFDPPYDVLPTADNFASYTKHAFGRREQKELASLFHDLVKRGVRCMLSNSDTRFVRGLYKNYRIDRVECARSINSNASGRGAVHEVIVMGGY